MADLSIFFEKNDQGPLEVNYLGGSVDPGQWTTIYL